MTNCMDENLRPIFRDANEAWKKRTRSAWHQFFIEGVAFQADWLGSIHPESTRAYLLALADMQTTNGAEYERAQKMFDVARRALMEEFEARTVERPKQ